MIRFILISFFIFNSLSFAQDSNLNSALKSYQSADYETAKKLLDEDLAKDPNDTLVLYNLGLSEYKLGNPGKALGYWRRALSLQPELYVAQEAALYAQSQLRVVRAEDLGSLNSILGWISENVPSFVLYVFALLFLFLFCFSAFKFFSEKRKALYADTAAPAFPIKLIVFFVIFIFFVIPFIHSYQVQQQDRGTIITKSSEVKTGPGAENATLFSLSEGEEVILLDKAEDWYKIKDRTGRLGWLSQLNLYITSER